MAALFHLAVARVADLIVLPVTEPALGSTVLAAHLYRRAELGLRAAGRVHLGSIRCVGARVGRIRFTVGVYILESRRFVACHQFSLAEFEVWLTGLGRLERHSDIVENNRVVFEALNL